MDEAGREAREAVRRLGRRGRTSRVPVAVREKVLRYAERERQRGTSWRRIAVTVGLSSTAVQRWAGETPPARRRLAPVTVTTPAVAAPVEPGLTLVTPTGYRLEGLGLEAAVGLLRSLS